LNTGEPLEMEMLGLLGELQKSYKRLEELSTKDRLTGISNRGDLDERIDREIKRVYRNVNGKHGNKREYPLSVLMIDIDHFKEYNDHYGHPQGDQALILLAQIIKGELRDIDISGRYGGEEFEIMPIETNIKGATELAERIRKAAEKMEIPWRMNGNGAANKSNALVEERMRMKIYDGDKNYQRLTVSIGVASYTLTSCDDETKHNPSGLREQLTDYADTALYQAKADGRNCIRAYHPDMHKN